MSDEPNDKGLPANSSDDSEVGDAGAGRAPSPAPSHRAAAEAAEESFFNEAAAAGAETYEDEEVDPELLRLPRRRRRRNPIISLTVIALSIYMMVYLRQDMLFYLQPSEPPDVGEVGAALKAGKLRDNTHVTVHGAPDRKHSVILEGGKMFSAYDSFFRLQQSGSRVFVRQHRRRRTTEREVPYTHTGRVVRFASLPVYQQLKAYFERTMSVAHDLPFDRVREVKASAGAGPARLEDRDGQTTTIAPDQVVWINVAHPGAWIVQFPRRSYAKIDIARQQMTQRLADLGLPFAVDDEASHVFWRFVVLASDEQIAKVRERFSDPVLNVGVVRREVSYTAKWKELSFDSDRALLINSRDPTFPSRFVREPTTADATKPAQLRAIKDQPVKLAREAVLYLTVGSKFVVPGDALVIVTRDKPSDYWHYLLLYLLLLTFVVFNAAALVARIRERTQKGER